MKIHISATGHLKRFIPEKRMMEFDDGTTLAAIKELCGIGDNVTAGYLLNGKIARAKDVPNDGDEVKFLMIVGAG